MASNFEWDKNAVNKFVKDVTKNYAADLQKRIDTLIRLHKGKPVDEVKRYLQADFRKNDGKITDPELTSWAQMISDGTKIVVRT